MHKQISLKKMFPRVQNLSDLQRFRHRRLPLRPLLGRRAGGHDDAGLPEEDLPAGEQLLQHLPRGGGEHG